MDNQEPETADLQDVQDAQEQQGNPFADLDPAVVEKLKDPASAAQVYRDLVAKKQEANAQARDLRKELKKMKAEPEKAPVAPPKPEATPVVDTSTSDVSARIEMLERQLQEEKSAREKQQQVNTLLGSGVQQRYIKAVEPLLQPLLEEGHSLSEALETLKGTDPMFFNKPSTPALPITSGLPPRKTGQENLAHPLDRTPEPVAEISRTVSERREYQAMLKSKYGVTVGAPNVFGDKR